ncbi:hypothetical protein [Paenibacillus tundrae]|nr:hypothetical protein [Paenibacillus tundrae]
MDRDYRALLLRYGYPEELISGWTSDDCEAEWMQFCSKVIPE